MKKQSMYLLGIALVVAILAGWYLYDSGFFDDSTSPGGGQFSLSVGTAYVVCELNFADGSKLDITGNSGQTLRVTNQEGTEVTSATVKLVADITVSGYTLLEMNLKPATTPPVPSGGETIPSGLEDVVVTHTIGSTSYGYDIYSNTWTSVYNQVLDVDTGQIQLVSTNTNFNTAFETGDPYGAYHFCWQFDGDACYRPGSGTAANPNWDAWSFVDLDAESLDACAVVTYAPDGDITITWDYDITWS